MDHGNNDHGENGSPNDSNPLLPTHSPSSSPQASNVANALPNPAQNGINKPIVPFAHLCGPWAGLAVAVSYGIVSITLTFSNKLVLSGFGFGYPSVLTVGQMVTSLILSEALKSRGLISYPDWNSDIARKVLPLSATFALMVISGLASMVDLNIPMFNTLRRATTLVVMASEYVFLQKRAPNDQTLMVVVMTLGAVVAGMGDLDFSFKGYVLVTFNCLITALYLILIARIKKETGLQTFGLMFYNNVLASPMVIAVCILTGEIPGFLSFESLFSIPFIISFLLSSGQALLLNYAIFLCTSVNSPLTTSITGQIKGILSTIMGLFTFGGVQFHLLNMIGLIVSSAASINYSRLKYLEMQAREKPNTI